MLAETAALSARVRFETLLGRVFLLLLITMAGLALVEIGSRWLLPSGSPIERAQRVYRRPPLPYVMFGAEGQGLNELGYPGPAPPRAKPAGEFHVFVLGASTVVNGDPPIPALLEQEFHRHGHEEVRVYNFGVISALSGQELARLVYEVADFDPDLVVVYDGAGDIVNPYLVDPRPGYPYNFFVYEANPVLESDVSTYPLTTLLAFGSRLLRYAFRDQLTQQLFGLSELRQEAGWGSHDWRQRISDVYVDNLRKAEQFSRGMGAGFAAYFQPLLFFKDPLSPEEQRIAVRWSRRKPRLLAGETREMIRARLGEVPHAVDLSDVLDGVSERSFIDVAHTNQAAKLRVARAIHDDLDARGIPSAVAGARSGPGGHDRLQP
jgi:hypothetical protein